MRQALTRALIAIAVCGFAVTLWDLVEGGFYFRVLGVRISSWEARKPFQLAMLAVVGALWLHDNSSRSNVASWHRLDRMAPVIAGACCIIVFAIAVHFGIFAAGGADGYGYVSQAYLWASGHLRVANPLAAVTPSVGPAVAPLGYRLADDLNWLVPVYPPGLPMLMAIALRVGGPAAVYFVVPVFAAAAVGFTYALARRVADPRTAAVATILFAFSPILIFQSLEPMSDVPVTACWAAAWWFALSPKRWAPLAAGLTVSLALLTRPNLIPLAMVLAVIVSRQQPSWRRLASFGAAVVPGCIVVAWFNARLYGSPLVSGYGPVPTLYAWDRVDDNLRRYLTWLADLHSPAIFLAIAAPFVTRVREAGTMLVFSAVVLAAYLFYFVFDSWTFVRFLLPSLPLLFILAAAVIVRGIEPLPLALRGAIVFLVCSLIPSWYLWKARDLAVFAIHRAEQRYPEVGSAIDRTLEPNAVVLTILQSGSIRMYGQRLTVRWDLIEPDNLDFTVKALKEAGYAPYVMVEEWEERSFRERFASSGGVGRLDWPAALTYQGVSTTRIYSVADRARQAAGACVFTRAILSATPPG